MTTQRHVMKAPVPAADAGIRANLTLAAVPTPGVPVHLAYRLQDARTGAPLTDVVESHERPSHLVVVRRDLEHFQHVHPAPTGSAGEYGLDVTFPAAGSYLLFGEFTRSSGTTLLTRDEAVVGTITDAPARLAEDLGGKTVGGIRVSLRGADAIRAGHEATLTYRLEDAETGDGVRDLRPYLGAPAHVVILTEDGATFGHTHGEASGKDGASSGGHGAHGGHAARATTYGPEIRFRHVFPGPGLYKLWGQFQTGNGPVITADFVVRAN